MSFIMDPFENLPAEIVQQLVTQTGDFAGVESLVLKSPWVNSVIQGQPRLILDLILSNPILSMPDIQQMLRGVAIISDASIQFDSLEDYQRQCFHIADGESVSSVPSTGMSPEQLLHILHVAAKVQRLACACLQAMRRNFSSAVERSLGLSPAEKAAAPFSWVEEHRVYWAICHLQHYSSLRNAAVNRWGWPANAIKEMAVGYTTWNNVSTLLPEQIWTVAAVLSDLGLHPQYAHAASEDKEMGGQEGESVKAAWLRPFETPIPYFKILNPPPYNETSPLWAPPPVPSGSNAEIEDRWSRTPRYRLKLPTSANMIRAHIRIMANRSGYAQAFRDFQDMRPFRRLGVAIWDNWRMFSVGLSSSIGTTSSVRTPDGGVVTGEDLRLSMYDVAARWLGLVGKPPPTEDPSWYS